MRESIIPGKSFKPAPYKIETPARRLFGTNFGGIIGDKAIGDKKKETKFKLTFGQSVTLAENEQFLLNVGARVTDAAWLRIGLMFSRITRVPDYLQGMPKILRKRLFDPY